MTVKYFSILSGIIITLLGSSVINAQTRLTKEDTQELLRKMNESCGNIKTVTYKAKHEIKRLTQKDTLLTVAVCSLYVDSKDRMNGYHIVDEEYKVSKLHIYGHRIYDGKRVFSVSYPVDSLNAHREPVILKKKKDIEVRIDSYGYLLLTKYFKQNEFLGKVDFLPENILITEEIFNNNKVYVITVNYEDDEYSRDRVSKLYVSKSNYLPVGTYSFWRWENMESYEYLEIEYLAINTDISLQAFKIEDKQTINASESFKIFREKVESEN